jgi:hypothetical protein
VRSFSPLGGSCEGSANLLFPRPLDETQAAQAQTLQFAIANAELNSKIASLESRLADAQVRIEMLESANKALTEENARLAAKATAVPPTQTVVDKSAEQVNRELAANLRMQRALALANAFKVQPVQVPLFTMPQPRPPVVFNPQINCTTSMTSAQSSSATCQ